MNRENQFLLETKLKEEAPWLHQRMRDSIFALRSMLRSFRTRFPDFTDHSILHSMNVLNYSNLILGEEYAEKLCPEECYALIMACYLHDIGMGITDRDLIAYLEMPENAGLVKDPEMTFKQPTFVRSAHHDLSGFLIEKYAQLFDFPSEEIVFAIKQISRGHRKTDLYDPEEFPDLKCGDSVIRTSYLAAVLRIADEMDIGHDRNLEIDFDSTKLTEWIDILSFGINKSVRKVEVTDDEIILIIKPISEEYLPYIQDAANEIQRKLDYCKDVAEKRSDLRIDQKRVVLKPWE